ncbi:MAG: carboxylating nicotinate-nucleotide diphosphorylase [Dehalococcoidia bacterium]|nr:carboxylating nicotinate-nucleotide diphosphorylase [Dehalococcoidia bacterium]
MGWKRKAEELVDHALAEDWAWGDVTTQALIPPDAEGKGSFVAKSTGVVAGLEVAHLVFSRVDPSLKFKSLIHDGGKLQHGTRIATIEGKVGSILQGERVALNFLQRLSGIATETGRYVEAVRGTKARIVDTRKTTPGLRFLEKYAVRAGGGQNHRVHLGDGILIKDNHLAALRARGLGLKAAIDLARKNAPHTLKIEVEVATVEEANEAVAAGADIVMLDNMSVEEMRRAVKSVGGRVMLEASGGVTLENVRSVAETGVDLISVGALTHSVKALDISLEMEPLTH